MNPIPIDSDAERRQTREFTHAAGMVLLLIGAAGLIAAALHRFDLLPPMIARWWLRANTVLLWCSIGCALAGCRLLWKSDHPTSSWQPRVAGVRFHSIVIYTRHDCPLCDESRDVIARYRNYLPAPVEVDVDRDPALVRQFGDCVPVVEIDGKVRFRGRISEPLLRRLIDSTPPDDPADKRPRPINR